MPYIGNLYLYFEPVNGEKFEAIKDSIAALLIKSGISQCSITTENILVNEELREVIAVRVIGTAKNFYKAQYRDEPASLKRALETFKVTSIKKIYQDWETGMRLLWSNTEEKPEL